MPVVGSRKIKDQVARWYNQYDVDKDYDTGELHNRSVTLILLRILSGLQAKTPTSRKTRPQGLCSSKIGAIHSSVT